MFVRIALWITFALVVAGIVSVTLRLIRVHDASRKIPVYSNAQEGPRQMRYWPHLLSWDDQSSARVDRIFAVPAGTTLLAVARHAANALSMQGWYLVTPDDLEGTQDPQIIVWQRDPEERLDLSQLWPVSGMSRTQRLYGGTFPKEFLDAPVVIGWTWALAGPRSVRRLILPHRSIVRPPPSPPRTPSSTPPQRF